MIISNEEYDTQAFKNDNIFIFSIGYEHRSCFLYNEIKTILSPQNIIVFAFNDHEQYPFVVDTIKDITKDGGIVIINDYSDYESFHNIVIEENNVEE